MFSRWLRSGIRTQVLVIVLISAVLTTAATLVVADVSITRYGDQQEHSEADRSLKIADLVRKTTYGPSISISSDGKLVVDSPTISQTNFTTDPVNQSYGRLPLNDSTAYVDQVRTLLNGAQVSIYQCQNQALVDDPLGCQRISTTLLAANNLRDISTTSHLHYISRSGLGDIHTKWLQTGLAAYPQTINGVQYLSAYQPLFEPDQNGQSSQQSPIGLLEVDEPLTQINTLIGTTTLFIIVGSILVMIAGVILAVLFASAISNTLQRAAKQLGLSSSQLGEISSQQSGGSAQQVWAINAINRGLHNLQETSADISRRTDQLAQIGAQVAVRRSEISPVQLESVMAYMTRSVRDISVSSQQHASTVDRMSSAMEAVIEVADQVANSSRQMTESAGRLDQVVTQLEQLVTGRTRAAKQRGRAARNNGRMTDPRTNQANPQPNMPMSAPMSGARPYPSDAQVGQQVGQTPSRPRGGMRMPDEYGRGGNMDPAASGMPPSGGWPMLPSGTQGPMRPSGRRDSVPPDDGRYRR